ncbi:MAG: hypothetical protein R2834_16640 [Rhodothermales bacterium]
MTGHIYLIDQNETLRALPERPYNSESLLQELLDNYPDLLAGEQMDEESPRRWLLVTREYGVPGEEDGYDRWSLDHLFLDQDGIPTLVEVKRSTDTRIRREVVGQMLDYAANAVAYWPIERIRQVFAATAEQRAEDPDRLVLQLLGNETEDPEAVHTFWSNVKTNLQAGRVRMVFVADLIPVELRRIVEFLNQQMDPAEVLAVEVKQFVGDGVRTLVPKVIGQTTGAMQKKQSGAGGNSVWTEERFLREMAERQGRPAAEVAKAILEWSRARQLRIWWGRGGQNGSFFPMLDHNGEQNSLVSLWTHSGSVEVQFQYMKGPFAEEAARRELMQKLNQIPGVALSPSRISMRPSFPIAVLTKPENLARLFEIWEEYLERIRAS